MDAVLVVVPGDAIFVVSISNRAAAANKNVRVVALRETVVARRVLPPDVVVVVCVVMVIGVATRWPGS